MNLDIQKLQDYMKNALLGIVALLIYFILPDIEGIVFYLLDMDTSTLSITIKVLYTIIYNIFIMALIILVLHKSIETDWIDMKKNHKNYFQKYFKYWLIGLLIMMVSNLIISFISSGGIAGNQESIEKLFDVNPLYVYFSAVIFAPVIEELLFRRAIYNIIPQKIIFIFISGIVFGGLHIIGNIDAWYDILYLIPYSSLGIAFAYILTKTNNIFVSMGLHLLHNGILIALQFFVLIFG